MSEFPMVDVKYKHNRKESPIQATETNLEFQNSPTCSVTETKFNSLAPILRCLACLSFQLITNLV